MSGMFRSLSVFNYRVWFLGALLSNIGVWVHRTVQDWLVLTELTDFDAVALGYMSALHYLPALIFMPITGMITDRFDKRQVLMVVQSLQLVLAAALTYVTLTGVVELWQMYLFAGGLGLITAFDQPARQTIVGFLVEERSLSNAVALNMSSNHGARLIGPAVAGFVVVTLGFGWAFAINTIATVGMLIALFAMRKDEIRPQKRVSSRPSDFFRGFGYVARHSDLRALFLMIFVFGLVGFNFSLSITSLTAIAFEGDAFQLGLVSSASALGGLAGSLLVARLAAPGWRLLAFAPLLFGGVWVLSVMMPQYWMFLLVMVPAGVASQLFMVSSSSFAQLSTEPAMRGRVIALFQGVQTGAAPLGALIMGWLIAELGPRLAIGLSTGVAGAVMGLIAIVFIFSAHTVRFGRQGGSRRYTLTLTRRVAGDQAGTDSISTETTGTGKPGTEQADARV